MTGIRDKIAAYPLCGDLFTSIRQCDESRRPIEPSGPKAPQTARLANPAYVQAGRSIRQYSFQCLGMVDNEAYVSTINCGPEKFSGSGIAQCHLMGCHNQSGVIKDL